MIDDDAFPVEPWQVRETSLDLDLLAQTESLFALSNGHIGLRGNLEEGEPHGLPGTYLNGFYETRPLPYAEAGFSLSRGRAVDRRRHQRQDHPAAGRRRAVRRPLRRIVGARTGSGHAGRHPGARARSGSRLRASRSRCSRPGWCRSRSAAWPPSSTSSRRSTNSSASPCSRNSSPTKTSRSARRIRGSAALLLQSARGGPSRDHRARGAAGAQDPGAAADDGRGDGPRHRGTGAGRGQHRGRRGSGAHHGRSAACGPGSSCASSSTWPTAGRACDPGPRCATRSPAAIAGARYTGWQGLLDAQRDYLDEFWDTADVEVDGDPDCQQAVRFGLFHVLQASARAERPGHSRQGPDRHRLRRARLLGHRGFRAAGADLHRTVARRPTRCGGGPRRLTWPASAPTSSTSRARPSRGAPSAARSARRTGPPAPRRGTSTPTSRWRSSAIALSPATIRWKPSAVSRCLSRRRGCGCRWDTTTATASGISTA